MRLKHDYQAAVSELARRLQGRPNLRRMVPVVVVDGRALEHADELKPTMGTWESLQGSRHVGEAHPALERHRSSACRVLHVVTPWLAKVDRAELPVLVVNRERTALAAA